MLFGGALAVHHEAGVVSVDTKLHFKAPAKATASPRRSSRRKKRGKKRKMKTNLRSFAHRLRFVNGTIGQVATLTKVLRGEMEALMLRTTAPVLM